MGANACVAVIDNYSTNHRLDPISDRLSISHIRHVLWSPPPPGSCPSAGSSTLDKAAGGDSILLHGLGMEQNAASPCPSPSLLQTCVCGGGVEVFLDGVSLVQRKPWLSWVSTTALHVFPLWHN